MSLKVAVSVFEGLARLSRRVWRHFVRVSREISLGSSLHRDTVLGLCVCVCVCVCVCPILHYTKRHPLPT